MRCVNCGLPLSPSRTQCPRCGTAIAGGSTRRDERSSGQLGTPQPDGGGFQNMPMGMEAPQQPWDPQSPTMAWTQDAPFVQQAAYQSANNQMGFPSAMGQAPDAGPWQQGQVAGNSAQSWAAPPLQTAPTGFSQFPQPPLQKRRTAKQGFLVASLCVLTGALILMLVYILSLNIVPSPGTTSTQTAVQVPTTTVPDPATVNQTQTASATATSVVTPAVTATAMPGQQYINNAQMATAINTTTALPMQVTNSFAVMQRMYVTFQLHPQSTGGAVCLSWYINQKQFSSYQFPVDSTTHAAYSYANAGSAGAGSVQIYWASTTTCTDKSLAQVVNFTIN